MSERRMPAYRVKAKFKDEREQTLPMMDGSTKKGLRRTIGVIWDNEGRLTFRPEKELAGAFAKMLGGKPGDEIYYDVFDTKNDGDRSGNAPKRAPVVESSEDDDFSFDDEDDED